MCEVSQDRVLWWVFANTVFVFWGLYESRARLDEPNCRLMMMMMILYLGVSYGAM